MVYYNKLWQKKKLRLGRLFIQEIIFENFQILFFENIKI
jgi:hypothetical protein